MSSPEKTLKNKVTRDWFSLTLKMDVLWISECPWASHFTSACSPGRAQVCGTKWEGYTPGNNMASQESVAFNFNNNSLHTCHSQITLSHFTLLSFVFDTQSVYMYMKTALLSIDLLTSQLKLLLAGVLSTAASGWVASEKKKIGC